MQCPSARGPKKVAEPAGEEEHALKSLERNSSGIGVGVGRGEGEWLLWGMGDGVGW
jgi:hypothetical protein